MFCSKCGKEILDEAVVCIHCGCAVPKQSNVESALEGAAESLEEAAQSAKSAISNIKPSGQKSGVVALVICFFFGYLGIHRFYSGHIGIGVAQLLTFGGCGIWALVDLIIIIAGNYTDSEGNPMKL